MHQNKINICQNFFVDTLSTRQVPVKDDATQKEKMTRQELFKKRQKEYQQNRNKKENIGSTNLNSNDWNGFLFCVIKGSITSV
jgi:hypothetical protein